MSHLLVQWYLDCFEVKIPEYQYTNEYFQFDTRWSRESMNYVVQQLLANAQASSNSDCTILPSPASAHLEDSSVTWGGQFEGSELVNTCPVDNFLTLLSLHSPHKVSDAIQLSNVFL
ncbi:hypothetical protein LOD99_5330 [Oopsacas minuta]|uniref:Uncharacterized protein n=1 Tax=Oopsacas minuta TaxID=111878 RepID=A0AAV7JR48_9METZ|nr:hypothetical protein LOD99_5330 [Oopsacas minuta]